MAQGAASDGLPPAGDPLAVVAERSRTQPRDDAYDVVVVGSGLGGINAGALLARHGLHVLVVERAERPGGYAASFTRGPYLIDPAVHVTGEAAEGQFFDSLLKHLGVRELVEFIQLDHMYRVLLPDGVSVTASAGLEPFVEDHVSAFPHEAEGIRRFVGLRAQVYHEVYQVPQAVPLQQLQGVVERLPTLFRYRTATMGDLADECLTDPKVKALCTASWPYMGAAPSEETLMGIAQFLGAMTDGPFYCRGSFGNLVSALATALEQHGGELVIGNEVQRIDVADGQVQGVTLADGRRVKAAVVVSNADATQTLENLVGVDHLPEAFVKRLRRLKPSVSAFAVYASTRLDMRQLEVPHETFLYEHWDHEETYRGILAGHPGGMWMNVPTLADPSLAPEGEHVVILTSLAAFDHEPSWDAERERFAERVIAAFDARFPGLADELTILETATPQSLHRATLNRNGAIYGWALVPAQMASKRLPVQTPLDGLYLAGHWSYASGSFASTVAGGLAARLVLGRFGRADSMPGFQPAELPPRLLDTAELAEIGR